MVFGVSLFFLHLTVAWWVIIKFVIWGSHDAQWDLIWAYFFVPDFPISVLHLGVLALLNVVDALLGLLWNYVPVLAYLLDPGWNLPAQIKDVLFTYVLPITLYGVVGPMWYFAIPFLISKAFRGRRQPRPAPSQSSAT